MDRLRKAGSRLVYRCAKQHSEPASDRRGPRADELTLTPLEPIARVAALVPPPRTHRHRYFGVRAPNSPLRTAVTALAQAAPYLHNLGSKRWKIEIMQTLDEALKYAKSGPLISKNREKMPVALVNIAQ